MKKKFGAFGGVFTPSILTILGVIMYLRLGWVVGNAGLWGSIFIVLIAHVISITTGLSISSISTDKKVGAGGVYYVLSRSLGLPIGGAIGLTLFIGTALSIALYIVGFSESFNNIIGLESNINNIRLTGSIALLSLTIIAFISTSLAIKTQYFILVAIVLSLVAIFFGNSISPDDLPVNTSPTDSVPFETVFAIFFPAVTGFTAGIAMSGDLKDPKKAIPMGTISAIIVGFIVYMGLVVFLFYNVDAESLKNDYNILEKIALFAPAVIAGIWGATLSSALGGILGGPRILQAMSLDKITPGIFGKEQGKTKEPRFALIVAIILAEMGILIGDLDIVARVVSMFYLAAYGFINISFFLESWASADFRPTFKVNKWIGFVGFLATFGVMFQLDMIAMFLALIIIGGIYLWLTRKEIVLGTGDIWRSVWSTSVKEGLKRLEAKEDHKRNWKPNILLFSGNSDARPHLIEFSQALAGRAGLVTNFDLIENQGMDILFTKHKQSVKDELLNKYGIFGRQIEVKNVYKGIETIASTFGFSGIDPNTVLMGWARNTKDPIWFAQMTQSLINLDYNVLYMDYDKERGFGQKERIDLWWRGISNNAELMLQIAKFISFNQEWRKAKIRILLVNDLNMDRRIIEKRISGMLEDFRLRAEIKVINNNSHQKSFYEILQNHSSKSDLILIGIPYITEGSEKEFVQNTNSLTEIIGTTLLVKASSTFDVSQLGLKKLEQNIEEIDKEEFELTPLLLSGQIELDKFQNQIDHDLNEVSDRFHKKFLAIINQHQRDFIAKIQKSLEENLALVKKGEININSPELSYSLKNISETNRKNDLPVLQEILNQGIDDYLEKRKVILKNVPENFQILLKDGEQNLEKRINYKRAVQHLEKNLFQDAFISSLKEVGIYSVELITKTKEIIKSQFEKEFSKDVDKKGKNTEEYSFEELLENTSQASVQPIKMIREIDRKILNQLANPDNHSDFNNKFRSNIFTKGAERKKEKLDFISNYAEYWKRNQELFHHRFETGIELKRSTLILEKGVQELKEDIKIKIFDRPNNEIKLLNHSLNDRLNSLQEQHTSENILISSPIAPFDFSQNLRNFRKSTSKATVHLPSEVEMMESESIIGKGDQQGKGVQTVSFTVDKIVEFLIESKLISVIQENLDTQSKECNDNISELNNLRGILNYQLQQDTNDPSNVNKSEKIKLNIQLLNNLQEKFNHVFSSVEDEVNEVMDGIRSLLDVQHIIDQAEVLSQYVRKLDRQKGLKLTFKKAGYFLNQNFINIGSYLSKKRQRLKELESLEEMSALQGCSEQIRAFVSSKDHSSSNESLPYYYKSLFTGKHLPSGKSLEGRSEEILKIKEGLDMLNKGISGAILISGSSLSGKALLTEYTVNNLLTGPVYYISAPKGGSSSIKDLNIAFAQVCSQKGSVEEIIDKLPTSSIFVFNDLELWWLNHHKGHEVINEIARVIKKYSLRHTFILNASIHSYRLFIKQSRIAEVINSLVITKPASNLRVKSEILRRHKIGNIELSFRDKIIDGIAIDRKSIKLFNRIGKLAGGNIGFAFMIWLNSISRENDGRFYISYPQRIEFPHLRDNDWNNMLLQLFLHQSLSEERFIKLYESMGKHWIEEMLLGLKRSYLLENHAGPILSLKKSIKPYLEEYLNEIGYL